MSGFFQPCRQMPKPLEKGASYTHFFPRKTLQPFSIALIYLYIRNIWLKGLSRKPFRTIHRRVALECLALCLPAPQFKADNFC